MSAVVASLSFFGGHLLFLALLTVTAWILGRKLAGRMSFADGVESFAVCTTLGLGALSWLLFVLGLAGGFYRVTVVVVVLAVFLSCWRELLDILRRLRSLRGRGATRGPHPGLYDVAPSRLSDPLPSGEERTGLRGREVAPSPLGGEGRGEGFGVGALLVALLPALLLPFYPPTVPDSTVYHLPLAEGFLEAHRPTFDETLRFPVFPLLSETLYATAMGFTSDVGAQLVHSLQMLLAALLVAAWGRRWGSRRAGLWAAALWLGTPLVVWIGGAAYVDIGLALFVTAALFVWEIRVPGDRRGLWIAGAFAGFAAGTKYLGLLFIAGLGMLALIGAFRRRRPSVVVAFAVAAVLTLAPWYGWIYAETGNPVFPFYPQLFGDSEWQTAIDRGRTAASELRQIATGVFDLLRVPWDAVFNRQAFGRQAPSSPFLLLLLPIAGVLALRRSDTRRALAWVTVYGLFWLTTVRDLRFLLAVLPVLAVALTVALDRSAGGRLATMRQGTALSWIFAGMLLAPGTFYAGFKLSERGWPPVDAEGRRAYLLEQVPEYAAVDHLNLLHGDSYTLYGLSRPRLHYYAEGRFLGSRLGPFRYRKLRRALSDSRELYRRLTAFGAEYFLFVETAAAVPLPQDPAFAELFEPVLEGDAFTLFRLVEESG